VKDILQHLPLRFISCFGIFLSVLFSAHQVFAFFSSIPDTPPPRHVYLTTQSPPKLRFHEVTPRADRRKLLSLRKENVLAVSDAPTVNRAKGDSFPLISYGDDSNQSSPTYEIPLVENPNVLVFETSLPPNDPFVSDNPPEPNIDNTDELMEILESNIGNSNRNVRTRVEFVPPYTMDGGNLMMESRTKYTRKVR